MTNSTDEASPAVARHPASFNGMFRQWRRRLTPLRRLVLFGGPFGVVLLSTPTVAHVLRTFPGRWLLVLLISWLVCLAATPLSELLALRTGAVDWPDRRKHHKRPTPRLGGCAIFGAVCLSLTANGIWDPLILRLFWCAGLLFTIGLVDDIRGVPARYRLLAQLLVSAYLISEGLVLHLLPSDVLWGASINIGLTLFWLVGITNAFNFFDGMDGLAAGLAVLIAGFLGLIAFLSYQPQLGWVSIAVAGAALGFLPYNFRIGKSAEVFMGDCGSTTLGFLLAGVAVYGEWAVGHPLADITPPVLVFAVLIYDMIHTTVSRIGRGEVRTLRQWLEYTGRDHLHHRLESLLQSKRQAVWLVLALVFSLGLPALVIRHVDLKLALVILSQCAVLLIVVTILERAGNRHDRRKTVCSGHSDGSAGESDPYNGRRCLADMN